MQNLVSSVSMATASSVLFALLSTCCVAWPAAYKRSYQYFPPMSAADLVPPNQWDIAQEPLQYEQPEDYYDNPQWADIEAISNLIDMYDNSPPVWGQIVKERPEDELHELKRSQPSAQGQGQKGQNQNPAVGQPTVRRPTVAPEVQSFSENTGSGKVTSDRGQKEFPLLRPPVKSTASPTATPGIVAAQLNSAERIKKPSPYDTLRKYLSIEDALKKEVEKRRSDGRHQKRSSFVSEVGSLTGQLNNLKKTMT